MTAELQRIPSLHQEVERLQCALEAEARQRALQREQTARQEKLVTAQQREINLLASKVRSFAHALDVRHDNRLCSVSSQEAVNCQ